MKFEVTITHSNLGMRQPLWPLSDLQTGDGEEIRCGGEKSVVREGAKVAVHDLYTEEVPLVIDNGETRHRMKSETTFDAVQLDAQTTVLLTTELLELILSFLPSVDLWRARHVNHLWSELVTTSPSLRRTLWITPTLPGQRPTHNQQPREVFKINPVLESLNLIKHDEYTKLRLATFSFPARWRTVKAPWRDLQICEPPIQRLFLRSSWLDKYLECEGGITAGMLADYVELSREGSLSSFHSG